MKATRILHEEHDLIGTVLDALERGARALGAGGNVPAEFFLDAAEFIRGFADGAHHRKEEGLLFEALVAHGFPREGGPVAVMLAEHEEGRYYTRGLAEAAERLRAGDADACEAVIDHALSYVNLLRSHIMKEGNILFPMAERALPASAQTELDAGFEAIEREEIGPEVHVRYRALARRLAEQAASAEVREACLPSPV
jgi:hemerythrin-like domain-containing protein